MKQGVNLKTAMLSRTIDKGQQSWLPLKNPMQKIPNRLHIYCIESNLNHPNLGPMHKHITRPVLTMTAMMKQKITIKDKWEVEDEYIGK